MLVTMSNSQMDGDVINARRPSKRLRGGATADEMGEDEIGELGLRDHGVDGGSQQGTERADTPDVVVRARAGSVCEDMNNPMMYSLERRFLSQQVLETPAGNGSQAVEAVEAVELVTAGDGKVSVEDEADRADKADECTEEADDEYDEPLFRIKSQLTYERGNSHSQFSFDEAAKENTNGEENGRDRKSTATGVQRGWETPCVEGSEGIGIRCDIRAWRNASADDFGNVACRFITAEVRTDEREGRGEESESDRGLKATRLQELQIPSSSQDANNESDAEVRMVICAPSVCLTQLTCRLLGRSQNRLTPAVHSADRVQLNNGFFPIFRSKKDCKIVYLIRHGESEFNAACSARGSSWEDPLLFDARLTCKGKSQALTLRNEVQNWDLPADVVWVTSPLTRAIQTLLHVHPAIDISKSDDGDRGHRLTCQTGSGRLENVFVLPEVTEKLHTSGDVGRNPGDLSREFPVLSGCLERVEDTWWYTRSERPNCSYKQLFQSHETKESVTRRVKQFRKWVIDRPERVFVAVGHSMFWRDFATSVQNGVKQETLRNCEWRVLHV